MTDYKCPYCGQDSYSNSSKKRGKFDSWLSVRHHISRCRLNSKSYIICTNYGPISIDSINKYNNIYAFKQDYPLFSGTPSYFTSSRNYRNITLTRDSIWDKNTICNFIQQYYKNYNVIPSIRDTPIGIMFQVKKLYGTWNKAVEAAGLIPNIQNGFGINTYAKDGILYRSRAEAYFVDQFLFEKEEYEYEKPYGNGWKYDFYLPKYNLYIELDGGLRPQRIEEKRKYHLTHGVNCSIIKTEDIYKSNYKPCYTYYY